MIARILWSLFRHAYLSGLAVSCVLLAAGCSSPKPSQMAVRLEQVKRIPVTLPNEPVVGPLGLSEAVERASAASEKIAELVATVDVVAQENQVVRDLRDPELRLGYGQDDGDTGRVRTSSGFETGSQTGTIEDVLTAYSIGLRFYLPNPWTRRAQSDAGTASIYAAIADVLQARWLMKHAVYRLYTEVAYLKQDLELANELVNVYASARKVTDELYKEGVATPRDHMTTRSRYLAALGDRDETLRRREKAQRQLASLVAVPASRLQIEPSAIRFTPDKLSMKVLDSLAGQAFEHRRDLAALHWRHVAAKAAHRAAKAERRPWFRFVQGSLGQSDSETTRRMVATDLNTVGAPRRVEEIITADDGTEDEWSIGTSIIFPFPRFSGLPDLKLAELSRTKLQESKARHRVEQEITDVVASVQSLAESRARHESEVDPLIKEMERELDSIQEAELDPTDMARIRERILGSKRVRLEADFLYQLSIIQLQEVLGLPLPRD